MLASYNARAQLRSLLGGIEREALATGIGHATETSAISHEWPSIALRCTLPEDTATSGNAGS
eukprot:9940651-Alexandrium_andersonii.AAC.1